METSQKPKDNISTILKKTGLFVLVIFLAKVVFTPLISSLFFNDHVYKPAANKGANIPVYTTTKAVSLQDVADSIERSCPIKIDSVTTLTSVVPHGKDTIEATYVIDIIKRNYNMKKLKKTLCAEIKPSDISNGKLNNEIGFDVSYIYKYVDKNGNFMFKIYFLPIDGYKPK